MHEEKPKQPNGDRSTAGAPRTGSHETVIAMKKAKMLTRDIVAVTGYGSRRVQQIWAEHRKAEQAKAPAADTSAGLTDALTGPGKDTADSKRAS